MNKLNYFLLAATALSLASCSQDEINFPENNGDASLHFSVKLPSTFASRSVGDGTAATTLWVLAYTADGSFLFTNEGDTQFDSEGSANVDLELAPNQSYKIVFFAGSQTALSGTSPVYSIDTDNGTLSVNYANMTSEGNAADAYDCFYYTYPVENATVGSFNSTIELTRPVAQINWGTDDLSNTEVTEKFGTDGEYIQTRLTATPYTELNFLSGEVSGNTEEIEFPAFAIPTGETYPAPNATGYSYVALEYLLAPSSAEASMDFTLWISNAGDTNSSSPNVNSVFIDVQEVSVQANYQTNIYGSLITDQTTITVSKDDWAQGMKPELIWDGTTRTQFNYNTSSKTVSITKASELAYLADFVSGKKSISGLSRNLSGYTVTLENDFDMGGFEIPMIGTGYRTGTLSGSSIINTTAGNGFEGIFDGQNHTISNFKVTGEKPTIINIPFVNITYTAADHPAGFFSVVSGSNAVVKNIIFEDIILDGETNGCETAGVIGLLSNGATIENITVKSGTITSKEGAGGIVGRIIGTGNVTGCKNYAPINVTNYNAGGIVGAAYETKSPGINITNCTNYGDITGANDGIGGIVGLNAAYVTGCENYGTVGKDCTAKYCGGIVGYMNSSGSIENCTNNGDVYATSMGAGILGFPGGVTYTLKTVFKITGNTNNGSVTSSGQAAGITCQNSATIYLDNNTNNAPFIKASSNAAGIDSNALTSGGPNGDDNGSYKNGYVNYGTNFNNTPMDKITGSNTSDSWIGTVWLVSEDAASTK